jgi:hypothetical protein
MQSSENIAAESTMLVMFRQSSDDHQVQSDIYALHWALADSVMLRPAVLQASTYEYGIRKSVGVQH